MLACVIFARVCNDYIDSFAGTKRIEARTELLGPPRITLNGSHSAAGSYCLSERKGLSPGCRTQLNDRRTFS